MAEEQPVGASRPRSLVIAGPGVPRGAASRARRVTWILVQSLLEWSGSGGGSEIKGHSLIPLMRGDASAHPGWAYLRATRRHRDGIVHDPAWAVEYLHFTWYEDLLFNLDEDPGELRDRSRDPDAQGVLRELHGILESEVSPEAVTRAGFEAQERMLAGFASDLGERGLAAMLQGRMGAGLARVLAARAVRDLAGRSGSVRQA